jgi:short-subunit dehydrogenase
MRLELSGRGVLVSSLHPIGTRTEFFTTVDARSGGSSALHTPEIFMQSSERVARAVVTQLRRGRGGEIWTSLSVRLLLAVATALPGLADRVLRAQVGRRHRHFRPAEAGRSTGADGGTPPRQPYDSA